MGVETLVNVIIAAQSIRDMPAVGSACLPFGLLCCLLLCVLYVLVRRPYAVVFALLLQVSKMGFWVCGSGGGSSSARYYLQVRRAKKGSLGYRVGRQRSFVHGVDSERHRPHI